MTLVEHHIDVGAAAMVDSRETEVETCSYDVAHGVSDLRAVDHDPAEGQEQVTDGEHVTNTSLDDLEVGGESFGPLTAATYFILVAFEVTERPCTSVRESFTVVRIEFVLETDSEDQFDDGRGNSRGNFLEIFTFKSKKNVL